MEEPDQPQNPETRNDEEAVVTRDDLYSQVWAEPMLKVAARFGVSSSYMARVCHLMNVPRPERGYWAKQAVGKQPLKPPLPEPRPGDELNWRRGGIAYSAKPPVPKAPLKKPKRKPTQEAVTQALHPIIHGAKAHFDVGRTSYDSHYLKPPKRTLVDLIVTKTGLDTALAFANQLFLEFEAHDCQVTLVPYGPYMHRAHVDEREVPPKARHDDYYGRRLWSPGRLTIAYVGTVAVGLTVIELSEVAEARYVKDRHLRIDEHPELARKKYESEYSTTRRDFPTGRLCLQAYSPDSRGEWTTQWHESKGGELSGRVASIVREIIKSAPLIAKLIGEGERKLELQRGHWEEEERIRQRKQAEELARKARIDSKNALLNVIDAWAEAKRIEQFLADVERQLQELDPIFQAHLQEQLACARDLLGSTDALERFRRWTAPEKRFLEKKDG